MAMLQTATPLYDDLIPGGSHWSLIIRRGHVLRLIDETGGASLGMLLYNPENTLERYNMPDTLKNQHTFHLTRGHVLFSDMGRVFASITRDDLGWHDTVSGTSNADLVARRWGEKTYQQAHNHYHRNGLTSFLNELAKFGLGKKDLTANLNWFSKVQTDDDGNMRFVPEHSSAGAVVDLRFEMDTLVVMHTCPHPLDTATEYPRRPVRYQLFTAASVSDADPCKISSPEATRAFANNALYHLMQ
ncbi:urea carboxylase-associated family protein [Hydrocarboniclastica marina]|uniref:Urea carboxylase-associated family protein n=2 Tax=Hydrocarboniclastica marina TaxID=2259620 RepID=A0A4P7XIW3_9ALTE|nr:urea carboxylase-associated family protein [Hydrocarboniclastica marina]